MPAWKLARGTGLLASACAVSVGIALAGCGSSSSSSSTASSSSTSASATTPATAAVAAHKTRVHGNPAHAGTIKPSPAALTKLVKVAKSTGPAAHIVGISKLPLDQQLTLLDGDINTFWAHEFSNSNVQWPQAEQVLITSKPVQTGCSDRPTVAPTDPWLLCDPVFFWPLPWISQNISNKGDVNLAFSVAEMWSFHVQNVLGFTQQLQQGSLSKGQWAQQTLCLTGIWVRTLSDRKLFEQGDTQAAQTFLGALTNVNGITAPDVSPQALQQAFFVGYNSGAPGNCGVSTGSSSSSQTTTSSST
ncbi:MAG: neutral zinc metallopeptidase [Solirubrobacterales bacterium]|nr:neutral zinc metallopeptidase [Solirubrobacterales bacterium]MBV9471720.1 neutral zinc metallopeptidase [Solirubrobacterales bacterium]